MHDKGHHHNEYDEPEEIEAYCVRCKQTVVMVEPHPVWTKRGAPGTRGECDICGSTIFRMGRTEAHRGMVQPDISQFKDISGQPRKGKGRAQAAYAAYINSSPDDSRIAEQLAEDLQKTGIATWYEATVSTGEVDWASGVHPALEECSQMVVVLSGSALDESEVEKSWQFFRSERKPVFIAQVEACEVPDGLRRIPRFDFSEDYKTAFRELVQAMASQ